MHIFISGIGGSGLSSLAHFCLDLGYKVSGSDSQNSNAVQNLIQRGVNFNLGNDPNFLLDRNSKSKIDYYIHTPALKDTNLEKLEAKKLELKIGKQNFLINEIIKLKSLKLIAVAGTHGKTTTTAMIVWLFNQLKIPVSYIIGTEIGFGNSGKYIDQSQFLVYEADEYDRKFLDLKPDISLVTSLDYDHPDTYPTKENYFEAFKQFIAQTSKHCFIYKDNSFEKLVDQNEGYQSDWMASIQKQIFLIESDHSLKNFLNLIKLPGLHNRLNGYLAVLAVFNIFNIFNPNNTNWDLLPNIDFSDETQALNFKSKLIDDLNRFPGTTRRFEQISTSIFSDYAHHPTEIEATLQLASEYIKLNHPEKKLLVVYQPHQNSRQHEVLNLYRSSFILADKIFWLPTYLTRENPDLLILQPEEIVNKISNKDKIEFVQLDNSLFDKVIEATKDNFLVLLLGAGNIDPWFRDQILKIK